MKDKPKPPPEADDPEQFKRFINMAREIQVDESPEALDEALKRVIHPTRTATVSKKGRQQRDQSR